MIHDPKRNRPMENFQLSPNLMPILPILFATPIIWNMNSIAFLMIESPP